MSENQKIVDDIGDKIADWKERFGDLLLLEDVLGHDLIIRPATEQMLARFQASVSKNSVQASRGLIQDTLLYPDPASFFATVEKERKPFLLTLVAGKVVDRAGADQELFVKKL